MGVLDYLHVVLIKAVPPIAGKARLWFSRQLHLILAFTWVVLTVPTVLWWKTSILWVLIISIYANVASHWSAWEGKRAGRFAQERNGDLPSGP